MPIFFNSTKAKTAANILLNSGNLMASSWTANTTATLTTGRPDPQGGNTAYRVVSTDGQGLQGNLSKTTNNAFQSFWAKSNTTTATFSVYGNGTQTVTITTTWQRFSQNTLGIGSFNLFSSGSTDISFWHPMVEEPQPSDYVGT